MLAHTVRKRASKRLRNEQNSSVMRVGPNEVQKSNTMRFAAFHLVCSDYFLHKVHQ
jgi:hypothetical protein